MLILKNVNFYIIVPLILNILNLSFLFSNEIYDDDFLVIKEEYLG